MSNMILTEGSFIEFVFLHCDTLGNMSSLSTSIRPNNINHQEKRHHSRRVSQERPNIKDQRRYNADLRNTQVQGSKTLPRKVCQELVLQYLLPSPSDVRMRKHHQGKSRKYVRVGHPSLGVSRLRHAYSAGEA